MEIKYQVRYLQEAIQKHITNLPYNTRQLIRKTIEEKLTTNPVEFSKPLQYILKNLRRFRIVSRLDHQTKNVTMIAIKHRKDIYE